MAASENEETIVKCGTTKGDITLKLIREWSPNGYDKAKELFERHFYDNSHFFRAVPKFLVQFGISYSKDKDLQHFAKTKIQDDPKHDPPIEFHPGIISYAGSGPNSRTSQLFISYGSAASLGRELWETPIGKVIEGMEAAEQFYSYGDMPPWGKGPVQGKIYNGPQYIEDNFPLIDKFLDCEILSAEESESGDGQGGDSHSGEASPDSGEEKENPDAGYDDEQANAELDDLQEEENDAESLEAGENISLGAASSRRLGRWDVKNKLGTSTSGGLAFPVGVLAVLMIVLISVRGRRKVTAKMN